MALGKTNRIEGKAYSLKLKLKDGEKFLDCARFDVQEKQGTEYVTVSNTTDVSGDLFKLTTRVFEHDKGPIRSFNVALRDRTNNEAYFIDVGLGSGLGRSLANSILNLKAFSAVEIGLYPQKSKVDGKTYPAASLRQGGLDETVKWAFDPKSGLPAAEEFKARGGKTEKDYTKQEEFLLEKLKEFGAKLEKATPEQTEVPKTEIKAVTTKIVAKNTVDEGVPF